MKTAPVEPARLDFDANGVPLAPAFGDVYHARSGALAQARHVFLGGNQLPARWAGRRDFVLLETGFGLGNNFLAVWDAWRSDPQRCDRLHYVAVERHPLSAADLVRAHARTALPELAAQLAAQWPLATPNLHSLHFAGGQVRLTLAYADVRDVLPELIARVDAFLLDGFAPARNPAMWERRVLRALGRLAAPGATAATWSVAREVRDGLQEAGFVVEKAPGFEGKREMTIATYAPRFVSRPAPARLGGGEAGAGAGAGRIVIVGAGLAGCATAWALAELGLACTLLERHAAPAQEGSGNPGGLFHGIVTPQDGLHARFNRAAALHTGPLLRQLIADRGLTGQAEGLLRLETRLSDAAAMQAQIDALGLPAGYVQALGPERAAEASGWPLRHPAWWYPGGGWVAPGAYACALLGEAGDAVKLRSGVEVAALQRRGEVWALCDAAGRDIECAETVVVAAAGDAHRLLAPLWAPGAWPLETIRGQISALPINALGRFGIAPPRCPLAGAGYALPAIDGQLWFGATAAAGDLDPGVRESDHAANLSRLGELAGISIPTTPADCSGRVGWRLTSGDRLPALGALPDAAALALAGTRREQPRFVPRLPGLHVHLALASRGITWAALNGRVLASQIAGTPCPVEAGLLDAIDVGRYAARQARRG